MSGWSKGQKKLFDFQKLYEEDKMSSIRDEAKAYVSMETLNISELQEVSTESEVYEKVVETEDGESFKYSYIVVNNTEYRVPKSVLKQLQTILGDNPNLLKFKVLKKGEGLKTTYTVVGL